MHLAALIAAVNLALAAATSCSNPVTRKEWRTLPEDQKKAYISAVHCLKATPPRTSHYFSGSQSRFDDFVGVHSNETNSIHSVGHFHPWHRYFVATYEADLRNLCGYQGAQPYWDWTQDATMHDFLKSPVLDAATGFGGNGYYIDSTNLTALETPIPGKTGGGCLTDGPFVNFTVNMGPSNSTAYNPRCLTRDISPWFVSQKLNSTIVDDVLAATTFQEFDLKSQGGTTLETASYHAGGHLGIGGDLGVIADTYVSPSDPLFYMHHANMDRLWWIWQSVDLESRLEDISGPDTAYGYPFGNVPSNNITLDFQMHFGPLTHAPWVRIRDVMDIKSGLLCYNYN